MACCAWGSAGRSRSPSSCVVVSARLPWGLPCAGSSASGGPRLLIADHITPPVAQRLHEQGVPFLDAAGNAYLEQPGLLVWVVGHEPAAPAVACSRARLPAHRSAGGVRAAVQSGCRRPACRELAAMAGVAHGTVGWLIAETQREGFLADLDGRHSTRRLFERDRLITQWADAYARVLRPRLL